MYVTVPDIRANETLYNHFSYAGKLAVASVDNTAKIQLIKNKESRWCGAE
jgi:hypothetical protein